VYVDGVLAQIPGPICSISDDNVNIPDINHSGLINCMIPAGTHQVEARFTAPAAQQIGSVLSLAGIGFFVWILFRSYCPRTTSE